MQSQSGADGGGGGSRGPDPPAPFLTRPSFANFYCCTFFEWIPFILQSN